ncbi:hypothetical protein GCM10008934_18680 [Virgibacillus salarius]
MDLTEYCSELVNIGELICCALDHSDTQNIDLYRQILTNLERIDPPANLINQHELLINSFEKLIVLINTSF